MTTPEAILDAIDSVLAVDWPSEDVPETLTRAGFTVVVHGGPGPEDYSSRQLVDGAVVVGKPGGPPEHADLVYSHRPLADLPGVVSLAKTLGATTIWAQSGLNDTGARDPKGCWVPEAESRAARQIVESAGLAYVEQPYIADVARRLRPTD